jgi:uncharacterized lipoprotein YajG
MIVRRLIVLVAMLLAAALLAGCGAQVTVLKQASPNPFVGQSQFALERMESKGLQVGDLSEERYLAEKDDDQRASFAGDKEAIQHRFDAALTSAARDAGLSIGAAGQAPFVIRPRLVFVEPGYYAVVASGASQATIVVQITKPDGTVLDEIEVTHQTDSASGPSIGGISTNPSSGGRLRDDAAAIGEAVGEYIAERAGK